MVGRKRNCGSARWARAKTGEGQVVLIAGEAGKSRLTTALMERLGGEPHTRLRYFCSPQDGITSIGVLPDSLFLRLSAAKRSVSRLGMSSFKTSP